MKEESTADGPWSIVGKLAGDQLDLEKKDAYKEFGVALLKKPPWWERLFH